MKHHLDTRTLHVKEPVKKMTTRSTAGKKKALYYRPESAEEIDTYWEKVHKEMLEGYRTELTVN